MAKPDQRTLTRTALIVALTLVFQSLRLVIPLLPVMSTFLIGSLVNACLLVALETVGLSAAMAVALIAPVAAYLQQLLPVPVFIVPVAAGNVILVLIFRALIAKGRWAAIGVAALGKTAFLYGAFAWLLSFIQINPKMAAGILAVMSWPQFVTALLGGLLATLAVKRLKAWQR
ncbi:MAG TPA: hypothetical protein PKA10_14055 [Selenomonadales bacterium]|nr:hypothetical protein [Selenomonadales bacterium]